MSAEEDVLPMLISELRRTHAGDIPPWPAGLSEEERVAFMSLPDLDAGLGIISVDPDFARRAIELGSIEKAAAE